MNQSTRRKTRHLLHFLLTWVLVCTQIAVPLGALLATVQPTPQMAQAVAQQAGLGDWIASAVGQVTAWAQPLWGQPKTAAAQTPAPGGVTANLAAWYKADGTVGATQWNDESGNGKHMLAAGDGTAARMPTVDAIPGAANNFNPRVAFLSNADGNRKWTMTASGNNVFANTSTPGTIFNISSFPDETVYDVPQMYAFEDDDPGLNLFTDRNAANDIRVVFQRDNGGTGSAGWDFVVPGVSQTQPLLTAHAWNYAAGGNTFSFNGYDYTPSSNPFIGATSPRYMFGSELTVAAGEAHSGYTSENIVYSTNWPSNSDERKRINSYLAIKYGITLLGSGTLGGGAADATFGGTADYLNSASTVIWHGTTINSSYHNNVAGIGRDDASALNQKQSTSANSGFQPVIGLGTIAASNTANSNTFGADKTFMVWGSNNGAASYGIAYTPTSFTPAAGYFRMSRVWKVQETGTVSNVVVQGTGADHLLVSSDPTFATGVTEVDMSSGSATMNFTNGQFFTFGTEATAPGGVAGNLTAWYKADLGAEVSGSAPSDNGSVDAWRDQGLNDNDAFQSNSSIRPEWLANNGKFNFNPSVTFVPDARLQAQLSVGSWNNNDGSVYVIYNQQTAKTGWRNLVDFGLTAGDSNNPQLGMSDNDRIATWMDGFDRDNTTFQPVINETRLAGYYWQFNVGGHSYTYDGQPYTGATGHKIGTTGIDIGNFANIGGDPQLAEYFPGQIAEIAIYKEPHNVAMQARVQSYFALKYGVTLDSNPTNATTNFDYVDSAGATIWAGNGANSGYHNDVAGIGRDDAAALNQKQSKSVNSDDVVTIGLGAIAATNAANGNTFAANKSFLLWGNNNSATTYSTSYNPTSFTPAAGYYRMNRIWKVQETGTITNVVVQATGTDHLLVSSDPTFATGVTEIDMSSGSATVNFTNGQFFTFGRELVAPGGVAAGLGVWLRADQGSSTTTDGQAVADWADFGPGGNDVTQPTAGNQPKFKEVNLNFNPALEFDGSNDVLYKSDGTTIIPNQTDPVSMLTVSTQRAGSGWWQTLLSFSGAADYPALHWLDGRQALYIDGVQDFRHSTVIPYNTPTMFVSRANNATPRDLRMANNGLSNQDTSTVGGGTFPAASGSKLFSVGSELATGSETLNGFMNEGIVYNRFLSDAEVNRIQTYFAVKYGITFDNGATNYVATDGTTVIWDATANSGYKNNIAGIGRDDAEALNQKQSLSINSGFQPTIGLGAIAATNTANTNTFSANKSYLIWGDNGQAASYAASYTPSSFTPAAGYYRMSRVWKVQETGTITNVVVQAANASHLLVSSDPTFATGVTEIAFSSGSATVNFANGQYFTFGQEAIGPGGVATNLAFWYKPEAGVSLVSGKVSSWIDQANGIEVTPAASNSGPTYYDAGTNLINFNPTLNFVNTTRQDGLRAASGLPAIPNGVSTFSVLLPDDASNRWFLQWGVFGAGYYNNYGHCNANNPGVWTNAHGGCVNNPTTLGPITTPSFLSVRWNSTAGTNQWQLRRNGQLHSGTTTATALNVPADTALEIGDVNQRTAGNEYIGNISEVIGYTARLSDTDRQKVESYLSIKYGITYMNDANTAAQDYLNAAGATVWDATANSSYSSNIAGIGRDDASALQQKQSQSVNSGFQPAIGLGTIATSNAANPNTFAANKSFLLWGSNNAATTLTANYAGGSNNRVARVWKVQETGTVGAVKVVIPRSAFPTVALRSLIVHASDPNFGTTDRTYVLVSTGGNYEATVDFNNGDFFTFSSSFTIPEINVTPGTLDFGEVNTGSTSAAQAVTIQNEGEVSLSLSNISLSGADAARFAISGNNCGATLSAGASCTVQLTFSPTTAGSRSALLVITSNDSDEGTVNVALSGTTPGSGGGGTPGTYNLAVTKGASVSTATIGVPFTYTIGVPFTYTITVLNKGTIAASNVTMTDQLPAGVTFGSANATGGGNCTHTSGTVTCTWASLAGGATATVTISVTP